MYIWTSKFVFSHLIEEVYAWFLLVMCNLQSLISHRNCRLHPSHWTALHTMWGISFLFFDVFTRYFSIGIKSVLIQNANALWFVFLCLHAIWPENIRISPYNEYIKTLNSNVLDRKASVKHNMFQWKILATRKICFWTSLSIILGGLVSFGWNPCHNCTQLIHRGVAL